MLPLYLKVTRYLVRGGYRMRDAAPGFAIADYAGDDRRERPAEIVVSPRASSVALTRSSACSEPETMRISSAVQAIPASRRSFLTRNSRKGR